MELHCMLKAKEREMECLMNKLSEKDELLRKYSCQIEELKKDNKNKCKKYQEVLKQLKAARSEGSKPCEDAQEEPSDSEDLGELVSAILSDVEDQRKSVTYQLQNAECHIKTLMSEKKMYLKERSEITSQLQCLISEKERLLKEITSQKSSDHEKEELLKTIDALKSEKNELYDKVNTLHENIKEINSNFKETRWALTSEVAEKHDQVQELKCCVGVLEEQLRQADMQTHFKDDIIKELRKELKASKKSERIGFYDVVNELKERKNQCASNVKFQKLQDLNKHSSGGMYNSAGSSIADKQDDKKSVNENEKLLSQIECLKKSLKAKVEELKCQEEFTRSLEEELTKTKMDLQVLEKFQRQERQSKSSACMSSEADLNRHFATLICAANKIEDVLRDLTSKHNNEISSYRGSIDKEVEKIRSVKRDLERSKSKNQLNKSNDSCGSKKIEELKKVGVCGTDMELPESQCNLLHISDVEKFREKAITGAVALEQMKEQIDILRNLLKRYMEEFPCEHDKILVGNCEDKFIKLQAEFDKVTYQICQMLQKFNRASANESYLSLSCDETVNSMNSREEGSNYSGEEVSRLKSECQRLQKEIFDQENASEKLKRMSKQLEEEIQEKQWQLAEYTRELDSKICEILKLRELIRKVCRRLKEVQYGHPRSREEETSSPISRNSMNLSGLFCDIQEFWGVLEKSMPALFDIPKRLREENEKLKEKLGCLEKCVCNKEETLRHLQDTVRMRECQIEELKSKMENSECQSSKLAQDVEEKCRLIANLQEAVRKCKQFEVNLELLESLRFEYCDLECKLEEYEKQILSKDQKLERLHSEIRNLSAKNLFLTEKLKILNPKLKILYKTSHLFEKTVSELEEELSNKEYEIESLCEKVKELEAELDSEFKKCEDRAAEDSKCIEELSLTVKNFQEKLYSAQENYNMSLMEIESRLKKEMEDREAQLNDTIHQLRSQLQEVESQQISYHGKGPNLESMLTQAESQQQVYENKIEELQKALECVSLQHEEERKGILKQLCDEKKENLKNKNLVTKLNESMKRKVQNERALKECMDRLTDEIEKLKLENQELRTEVEARKKVMSTLEIEGRTSLSELEEVICSLKFQKAELRSQCYNLKAEVERETRMKRMLECRVDDLNSVLQSKMQKFNEMVNNYKCTSSRLQQTYQTMKEIEDNLICSQNNLRRSMGNDEGTECSCLRKLLDVKIAENAKLICQVQVLKVEIESIQSENAAVEANKDGIISRLQGEVDCLESRLDEIQCRYQKLSEENQKLLNELECWTDKGAAMQNEFRERQKDLCGKLRTTISEKNDLLNSLDELQKQLEEICLDNVNKEKINRELSEKCSRLKLNKDSNDSYLKNKTDKIISNLSKEVKNLHQELCEAKENYNVLNEEYQALLDQFKCCEKKKCNLEKLYMEASEENKELLGTKTNYERELCELKTQNLILKDKLACKDGPKNSGEKIKELTLKIKTLEMKVIPELEQEIADKMCYIESLKVELKEANISSQRMRNEALKVIEHTRKYLAAQRYANETLKSRLECSNKRGNMLGIENRELEEQLKAVTRMNEFLLCQLESGKSDGGETEPRSFSPLPWGCSVVERDTSSSEYLAESGFQSMQPSPVIMDYDHESQYESKRNCPQWNSLKKNKCGESVEFTTCRNGLR